MIMTFALALAFAALSGVEIDIQTLAWALVFTVLLEVKERMKR